MTALVAQLLLVAVQAVEQSPEPEDVKAGWTGFAVFILLIGAVAFLGWSLTKHLRKAQANEEAGLFGTDEPAADGEDSEDSEPERHQTS